tara:strand:- start:565 stop:1107 length:543 start_codon:yes stop_codon:yes gene_type:complete
MAFIAAMALGGAAIGALANKKDRKKGALMGLGLGLLGPLAAGAGAAGAGAAGAGTAGAGAAALAPVSVGSVVPASAMVATPAAAGTIGTGVGGTGAAATTTLGKIGSALTGETAKKLALSTAPVALQLAMTPGQQQQAPAGRSLALQNQQGERVSPYQRAALNRQQRMKGQGQQGPKRFV